MEITGYTIVIWGLLLVLQNASFTWVSRARNGGNDAYHAVAATASNGIWFAANFLTFGHILDVMRTSAWTTGVLLGVFYTAMCVIGSVSAGWFLRTRVETGSRRVGHYDDKVRAYVSNAYGVRNG
jgi:hypothetical protein